MITPVVRAVGGVHDALAIRHSLVVQPSGQPVRGLRPPSGDAARALTILGACWLWMLLPLAVHLQRKARREADSSNGLYVWPRTIWNRPIVLWLLVMAATLTLVLAMVAVGAYGD